MSKSSPSAEQHSRLYINVECQVQGWLVKYDGCNCCTLGTVACWPSRRFAGLVLMDVTRSVFGSGWSMLNSQAVVLLLLANFSRFIINSSSLQLPATPTFTHLQYPFHSLRGPLYLYSFNPQLSSVMLSSRFMRNVSRLPHHDLTRAIANPSSTGRASRHLHPPFFRIQSSHQLIIQEIIRRED